MIGQKHEICACGYRAVGAEAEVMFKEMEMGVEGDGREEEMLKEMEKRRDWEMFKEMEEGLGDVQRDGTIGVEAGRGFCWGLYIYFFVPWCFVVKM